MRFNILVFCLLIHFVADGQDEASIARLVNDKTSIYIDSSILFATDTNRSTKLLQPHGIWRLRDPLDGTLISVTVLNNGMLNGHSIVFYPNGRIATSSYNLNDQPHGPFIAFWINGRLQGVKTYKAGKLNGLAKEFDILGNVTSITEFKNGKKEGMEIIFYSSGNVRIATRYSQSEENGSRREYLDDEKMELIVEYEMKNGVEVVGRFYDMGVVIRKEQYDYEKGLRKKEEMKRNEKIGDGGQ